jgi:nucleoside-diphosphate-sugar epimerase
MVLENVPIWAPMLFAKAITNGDLNRDFTYVDEIVEGIIRTQSDSNKGGRTSVLSDL